MRARGQLDRGWRPLGEDSPIWHFIEQWAAPDAGSDLARLGTRATLDGNDWTLQGQKIWTSNAHLANWIFVLARSDAEAARHRGLTFLLVPISEPGIEPRPIAMLNGEAEFCETFFDGARTSDENRVGPVHEGWRVAMTLLGHERGEEAATNPLLFRKEFDRLLALAQETGHSTDRVVRQRLADCYVRVETMRFLGLRILTDYLHSGTLGPTASVSKL